MKHSLKIPAFLLAAALAVSANSAEAISDSEIKSLMKKSDCFRCHAEERTRDGPSYRKMAEKNRAKPNIEAEFYKRITTFETVEIKGKKEDHEPLKSKNPAEIRAVVSWILAR